MSHSGSFPTETNCPEVSADGRRPVPVAALELALDLGDRMVLLVEAERRQILWASAAACRHLGYARPTLAGRRLDEVWPAAAAALGRTAEAPAMAGGVELPRTDGSTTTVDLLVQRSGSAAGTWVLVARECDASLGGHRLDPLTGLPDRREFRARLEEAILRARTQSPYLFAVLFIDLDDFKPVNDQRGHRRGDQVLAAVGQRLKAAIRPSDFAARHGGDEFTLLVDHLPGPTEAARVAQRVAELIRQPIALEGGAVTVAASIGVALSRPGDQRPEDLLDAADQAMYRAKLRGGGVALADELAVGVQEARRRRPR